MDVLVQQVMSRVVVGVPRPVIQGPQLVSNVRQYQFFLVGHGHFEGNGNVLPVQGNDGAVGLDLVEVVGERFVEVAFLRLHVDAQRVFLLVVGEAAPGGGV